MRRPIALLALVVALLAAAGCGGGGGGGSTTADSKAEYGKELAAATAQLQRTFGDISDQTGSNTSSAQIAARLDRGADAIDQSADKFAAITPPAAAKDAHAKLVTGLHEIADQLRKAADAARKNDSKTLAAALQNLLKGDGAQKLAQATAELKKQGIATDTTSRTSTTG
ncbi:hypothetical protein [Conexibacter woesei]|uniref:hypothetical protein n=1 Tax=Conexibacter woesei TaxID=191495 RepID=UPI000419BB8A|nr:hypothetical protein [Conexibacter woesei]